MILFDTGPIVAAAFTSEDYYLHRIVRVTAPRQSQVAPARNGVS